MNDPISDLLTRIRNASHALLPTVQVPHSRLKESIVGVLKREGYVADYSVEGTPLKSIKIKLKYQGKKGVIEGLQRISSPGLRRYSAGKDMPRVRGGLGVAVISTSEGVMTGMQARKKNIGGEVLCYIW